jgi:hypothetical protein
MPHTANVSFANSSLNPRPIIRSDSIDTLHIPGGTNTRNSHSSPKPVYGSHSELLRTVCLLKISQITALFSGTIHLRTQIYAILEGADRETIMIQELFDEAEITSAVTSVILNAIALAFESFVVDAFEMGND